MEHQRRSRMIYAGMLALVSAVLLCCGCRSTGVGGVSTNAHVKRPLPFKKLNVPTAELLDETPLHVEKTEEDGKKKGIGDRKIEIPSRTQSSRPKGGISDYPEGLIKGIKDPKEEVNFELNLDNAQITEMVSLFAAPEILNFSYLVDPSVKGAVTVNIKTTMKAREIWDTMQHLLWLSGAYASPTLGFINILPFEKMPKERKIFATHEVQPNVEVLFIPIKYKKSADIVNLMKPFMTDGATATDLTDSNTVLIVEAPANVEKLKELIKFLDSKGEGEWPVRCFQCREVDSDELTAELQSLLPVLGMPVASATGPSGGAIKITSLPRLGSIVVSASLDEILDEVATWVKILDRSDLLDKEEIYFYNVRHSTVDNLSAALDAFFNTTTTNSPTSSSTSTSRKASSSSTSNNTSSTNRASSTNRNTSSRSNSRTTYSSANKKNTTTSAQQTPSLQTTIFDTEVTVYTDDESNRLTVKTTQRTWNMIKAFLERQDVPPRQVSIRAIITDISLTQSTKYGISYSLRKLIGKSNQNSVDAILNGAGTIKSDTALTDIMSDVGLGILYKDSNSDPLAFVEAVAGAGNTRILSEPHVLALSGATAKIAVGKKVAIPTESTTYSTDSDTMRSNYEYVDTGVIMEVTPYITAGNDVRLEISQEVSSAEEVTNVNIPPTIVNKTMSTELVVPDNSTLMMGGMIQTDNTDSNSGIPYLKDIPYLGYLFRHTSTSDCRTELLILLTVNVVDSKNPQEELVRRYKASLEEIEKANRDSNLY